MIKVRFLKHEEQLLGFEVSGHASYSDKGRDVVCASVTSAVQMASNTLTEILGAGAQIKKTDAYVSVRLTEKHDENKMSAVNAVLEGMRLHIKLLEEDYRDFIKVEDWEV
jgi:uncharacterized protein YsxB (DUF464 family)